MARKKKQAAGGSGFFGNVLSAAANVASSLMDESSSPSTPVEEAQPSPVPWRDPFNKNSRPDHLPPSPSKNSNREGGTMAHQASNSSPFPNSNSPTLSRFSSSHADRSSTINTSSSPPSSVPLTASERLATGGPLVDEQKRNSTFNSNSNNSDSVSAHQIPLPPDTASEIIHRRDSVTVPPDSPSEQVPLQLLKSKTSQEADPPLPTDSTAEDLPPAEEPKPVVSEAAVETSITASTADASVKSDVKQIGGVPTPFTQAGEAPTSPKSSKGTKSPQVQTTLTPESPPLPPPKTPSSAKKTDEEEKEKDKTVEPAPSHSIDSTPRPSHITLQNPPVGRNSFAATSSSSNNKPKDSSDSASNKDTKQKDPIKPVDKSKDLPKPNDKQKDIPKPVDKSKDPLKPADKSKDPSKPVNKQKDLPKPNGKSKDTSDTSSVITPKSANRPLPSTPNDRNPPSQSRKLSGTFTETDADPSTYGTPLSTATNTRASTPSTVRGLMMHDTVKRTTTIDWYIKLPLNPDGIPVDYETHTLLSSASSGDGSGTVTWKTDTKENAEEPVSIISFDCPARLDLRIYSTTTSQSPIIDRYVDGYKDDAPKMVIPWSDLKGLTGGKSVLELLVSISMTDAKEPLPSDPIITETCSPASIEALGGFLDQPGGHDVVFQFPGRSSFLYADRYMLQRASVYFRSRLQLPGERGERSSTPTNTSSSSRKKLDDDSDDEFEGEDEESKAGVDTGAPNGIGNGTSLPQTPLPRRQKTSVAPINTSGFNGSATPPPPTHSKIDFHGVIPPHFRLEQVGLHSPVRFCSTAAHDSFPTIAHLLIPFFSLKLF
ncbi:hypothetical protein FRC02_004231 [Tulasnella sp. 418]|nr:hypothetical protein FRC02_004231 [Tulasnella sp. 418]